MMYDITIMFKDGSTKEYMQIQQPNLNESFLSFKLASGALMVIFTAVMNGYCISEVA